jgi:parallel beta-helix repeat protein
MTITTRTLSKALLFLTPCAPVLFGANRVVSNAGVIVGCPAQYQTIKAAIIAASATDTVFVCNTGVPYNEQVTISKSITLAGQTGAVIQPSPFVQNATSLSSGNPIAAAILVTPATMGVVISNLIIDGSQNQISGCGLNPIGVYFQNASGTVVHTAVRYFELDPADAGCQTGIGIFAQADGAGGISNVIAEVNSVHDFQKTGIVGNEIGTTLTATSNVVTGSGPTPNIAQNGIQIGFGATGTISGNTVSNLIYSPCVNTSNCPGSSTGILIYDPSTSTSASVNTKSNNVSSTQGAIYYLSANDGTISGNTISATLVFDGIGIDTDGTSAGTGNTVTQNTIMNSSESGVYVDTANNSLTGNTIIETPIGLWFVVSGNTQSGNKFFATPLTVQQGTPPAPNRNGKGMKPQPIR